MVERGRKLYTGIWKGFHRSCALKTDVLVIFPECENEEKKYVKFTSSTFLIILTHKLLKEKVSAFI